MKVRVKNSTQPKMKIFLISEFKDDLTAFNAEKRK